MHTRLSLVGLWVVWLASMARAQTPDTTPPSAQWLTPAPDTCVAESADLMAHVTDAESGVAAVSVSVDGGTAQAMAAAGHDIYTLSLHALPLSEGTHTLTLQALDLAGNTAQATLAIRVDHTPPDVAFVSPANGVTVKGTLAIEVAASDSDLSRVEIRVDGVSLGVMTAPPFVATFNTLTILDGLTVLEAIATDHCGNVTIRTITVTVDNIAFRLTPVSLRMQSRGGAHSVTAHLTGENVALVIPTEAHNLRLVAPSGASVQSTPGFAGDDRPGGSGANKTLTVKFDRQALIAAIGPAQPGPEPAPGPGKKGRKPTKGKPHHEMIPIRLLAESDREIGVVMIRIIR